MPTTTMSPDKALVEEVHTFLQAEHLNALGTALDHDTAAIEQTFAEVLPLVVSALAGRARQPNGSEALWTLTRQAHQHEVLQQLSTAGRQPWHGRGVTLMQGLLADAYASTTSAMAARHNLSAAEFQHLLDVAVAAVLGTLGKHADEHGLNAAALSEWLQHQPASPRPTPLQPATTTAEPIDRPVAGPVPTPASAPRRPAQAPAAPQPAPKLTSAADGTWGTVGGGITFTPALTNVRRRKAPKWQWALLLVPALGLGFGFGYRSKLVPAPAQAIAPVAVSTADATSARAVPTANSYPAGYYDVLTDTYIRETGPQLLVTLADGNTLNVGTNSTEYQLYRFLSDPSKGPNTISPAVGWVNLDRVYFEPGRATLTDGSREQLRNVAKLLKAFPEVYLQLGGYTDGTGDPAANLKLSQQRADEARRTLVRFGVDPRRLRAEGFGANYFIASNAGAVGRALNRRLSVRVISKDGEAGLPRNMLLPPNELPAPEPTAVAKARNSGAAEGAEQPAERRKRKRVKAQPRTKAGVWIRNLGQRLQGKRVTEWEKKR